MLFNEDSDEDTTLKTDNTYATRYDGWRKKEELHKLKAKYGEISEEDSSTSSDDDEDGVELTEEVEKEFYTTLSCLINKDPKIYDKDVEFFKKDSSNQLKSKEKNEKPVFIKDYERELILKHEGKLIDEDADNVKPYTLTRAEEERHIKESFKNIANSDDDDDGILSIRRKTKEESLKEEADYKVWLKGQKEQIDDKEAAENLKPLKDYWSNPRLDAGEKFVRDYILNKRFLSTADENYIPTYEEIVHDSDRDLSEDEAAITKQEEFEHKYNFRFEEPDQEFIKRYPRTMDHSLRKTDDRRKLKRVEIKDRKQKEKEEKMQELKRLQELKLDEINEKIEKLKEITGNNDMAFHNEDVEGEFDPEAHDKRMQALFNQEFYEGPEGDAKPEFPEIDEYLEIENWKRWGGDEKTSQDDNELPHCEDEDFNMDCDYDASRKTTQDELIESSKNKRKRKRKSLFAKAVSQPKPQFDPNDKTFEQYLDEYYKFDCEDIIGDIPCRFKYRKVAPNSFGLTIEEILKANDRELNRWCSLKKAIQFRPDDVEKYDQIAYDRKGQNINLKKKIIPSLFAEETSGEQLETNGEAGKGITRKFNTEEIIETKPEELDEKKEESNQKPDEPVIGKNITKGTKRKRKKGKNTNKSSSLSEVQSKKRKVEENTNPNIKILKGDGAISNNLESTSEKLKESNNPVNNGNNKEVNGKKKKRRSKKKKKSPTSNANPKADETKESQKSKTPNKERNGRKKQNKNSAGPDISDSRLTAYGINPKKFKNKLKYKR